MDARGGKTDRYVPNTGHSTSAALVGGRHDPEGLGERVLQRSRRDTGLIGHRAVPL